MKLIPVCKNSCIMFIINRFFSFHIIQNTCHCIICNRVSLLQNIHQCKKRMPFIHLMHISQNPVATVCRITFLFQPLLLLFSPFFNFFWFLSNFICVCYSSVAFSWTICLCLSQNYKHMY